MKIKFIADVHLGKLARLLRMLGFDTVYKNSLSPEELIKMNNEEDRIVLSKASSHSRNNGYGYLIIINEDPLAQLQQVIQHFNLKDEVKPFSRCIVCNGELKEVAKEEIKDLLQQNTYLYFNEFWQCDNCKRIYWKGSHYERMLETIESIIN